MRTLRDAPIKEKLLVIVMMTTAAALLLSGAGIILLDTILFRSAMRRDLTSLASIAGDNITAALSFNDPAVAAETLAALHARPHLVNACVYATDGSVFARYVRLGASAACPAPAPTETIRYTPEGIHVSHPIMLKGQRVGTLVMLYDLGEISERIRLYGAIVLIILLASSAIAFLLSSQLRALIATPIGRLAQAAKAVSQTGDYTVRVQKDSADELGVLVDAFNEMLARIQSRNIDVQNARNVLQITLSSIGDAVISTDIEGRITFANPVALSLLRWPQPDLAGRHIEDVFRIVNEFSRAKVESPVEKVLREGRIVGMANHTVLLAGDGSEIPIDDSAAPIQYEGHTIGVVLVFRDIRERRRAQHDAAYLAAIVESSDDAIIGKTPNGIIQSWNAGAEQLYGWPAGEVIGRPMSDLMPPDRVNEEAEILRRIGEGERVVHFETVRTRKNGERIDVSLTISPIHDKTGQVVGVSHVARNITEQKRSAEQLRQTQKLESLGILAGGIAHDFNNLLTGILGNASLLTDLLPPYTSEWRSAEQIADAAERAAKLTQQMLAYSGRGRFVVEPVNISKHVRDIAALVQSSIPKSVELKLQLSEHPPLVEADTAQLQQLVMNLVINGAEAIGPEGGSLAVVTRPLFVTEEDIRELRLPEDLHAGLYAEIEVRDTGCGMDEATLSKIFDPFFTTKFTGRGLGLAAVQGIVRGHKGAIKVYSTPGVGTTFRVLLPASASAQAVTTHQAGVMPELNGSGTVLVVDDEPVVRSTAKIALERVGYRVVLATNGGEAVDLFSSIAADVTLVLLDMTMPGLSGEETMERLRRIRPDVAIMVSSGFSEAEALRRFSNMGLAGFLQKPYSVRTLAEKVKSVGVH
jgi:PAS domain S-box-containing protein